jgi:hypothetical protein
LPVLKINSGAKYSVDERWGGSTKGSKEERGQRDTGEDRERQSERRER